MKILLDEIRPTENTGVLDVGCGYSRLCWEVAWRGAQCVGVDLFREGILIGNIVKRSFHLGNLELMIADGCQLPFADSHFDVVVSTQFFEHTVDIDLALAEQIRVLKEGGKLIIVQSPLQNPLILFELILRYPVISHGQHGGLRWIFGRSRVVENAYGHGFRQRDENVHSTNWWKKKISRCPELVNVIFKSYEARSDMLLMRKLSPLLGSILITANRRTR